MSTSLKENIKHHFLQIADDFLDKTIHTDEGFYWETLHSYTNNTAYRQFSESIYSGSSGIILFFIELYKVTLYKKYLLVIEKGLNYIIYHCKKKSTTNFAFFTGRMGVSYVLLKGYDVTKNEVYLNTALELAKGSESSIYKSGDIDDLLNGTAGILLGLLHLYSYQQEEWIKTQIKIYVRQLVERSHLTAEGIFWDRSEQNKQGLLGFSHGACGVAWVLLEAGNMFNCKALKEFSLQAIHFENAHFDKRDSNWKDFRKGIYDEQSYNYHIAAYKRKDMGFFLGHSDMSSWCHGAPGIGLCRLRFMELLNEGQLAVDLKKAIKKTRSVLTEDLNDKISFTLCHAFGGNSLLLLKSYISTNQDTLLKNFNKKIEFSLKYIEEKGFYYSGFHYAGNAEDLSLFMGNAGVGYFLLNAYAPDKVENYLVPSVKENESIVPDPELISKDKIYMILKKSIYPLTFSDQKSIDTHEPSFNLSEKHLLSKIKALSKQEVSSKNDLNTKRLLFNENKKFNIRKKIISFNYDYIENIVNEEINRELANNDNKLLKANLKLNNNSILFEAGEYYLIIETYKGSNSLILSQFSYTILNCFNKVNSLENAIPYLLNIIDTKNNELFASQVLIQAKEFLKRNILVVDKSEN